MGTKPLSIQTFERAVIKTDIALLKENMDAVTEEVLNQICDLIVGYAKIYVPVDTGSLRDSIRKERGGEGLGWRMFRVRAGGHVVNPRTGRYVDYAALVEARYPFMAPALAQVDPEIANLVVGKLMQNIDANVTISAGSIIATVEVKPDVQNARKYMQGFRDVEYILRRSIDIFRRVGLPEEFDGAMQRLTQILLLAQILQTTMAYLSLVTIIGGPFGLAAFGLAVGFLSGAAGIIVVLDILNNLG
jgi:hypothetical protein